jgi:hypothetical protein
MIGRPWLAIAGTLIDPQAGRARANQLVVKNEIAR